MASIKKHKQLANSSTDSQNITTINPVHIQVYNMQF